MKKLFSLVAILVIASSAFAQNFPEAFNYQAVIRKTDGSLIIDKKIGLQIGIAEDSINGKVVYSEKHFVQTNKYGLVEVEVGRGAADNGKFADLVWGGKRHFIRIGFSENASPNFNFMGASELLSAPYAHYAKHSGDALKAGSGIKIENGIVSNTAAQGPKGDKGEPGTTGPAGTYTAGTGISIAGNTISNTGDLSATNEIQTLSLSGSTLSLSNGGGAVTIDPNSTNEIQTLSLSGSNLSLSNGGGTVALPSSGGFWSANGSDIYKNNSGNVGVGTTSPSNLLTLQGSQASFGNTQRDFIFLNNTATGSGAYAGMTMKTGNSGQTYITQHDASYGISGYENFGQVTSTGAGFIVRAGSTSGVLKFQTGFNGVGVSDSKMYIAAQGNVGVGNENPTAKLQVTSGDVYIDTVSSGVIMKSPNGSCWRMTVSNTGLPVFTAITCP